MTVEQLLSDPGIFAMHRNGQTGYLSSNTDTTAIFEFMRAGSEEDTRREPTPLNSPPDLAKAKENLEQFDFVGTCDDLDSFFPAFCEAMGYHPVSNFQNDNNAPEGAVRLQQVERERDGFVGHL